MEAVVDFIEAALPWIVMGLGVAIVLKISDVKSKKKG